jgi:hypothetical protein
MERDVPVMPTKHNARLSKLLSKHREISGYFLEGVFLEVVGGILYVISIC